MVVRRKTANSLLATTDISLTAADFPPHKTLYRLPGATHQGFAVNADPEKTC